MTPLEETTFLFHSAQKALCEICFMPLAFFLAAKKCQETLFTAMIKCYGQTRNSFVMSLHTKLSTP